MQATGQLGSAPLSTAPTTTLQLPKTPLVTQTTTAGNGTAQSAELLTNAVVNSDQTKLDLYSADNSLALSNSAGRTSITAPMNFLGHLHGVVCNPDNGSLQGFGATPGSFIGSPSNSAPTATEGPALKITSQAISGGQGTAYGNNITGASRGSLKHWAYRGAIGSNGAGVLWYAGFSDVNPGTTLMQTTPSTQNIVGFRWHSGDANWTCCTCDGGGSITLTDSGVAVDTNYHVFEMLFSAGQIVFMIDGVTVATNTTNLPAASTVLGWVTTIQANAVDNLIQYVWWSFSPVAGILFGS